MGCEIKITTGDSSNTITLQLSDNYNSMNKNDQKKDIRKTLEDNILRDNEELINFYYTALDYNTSNEDPFIEHKKVEWGRVSNNGYELSSEGDLRFSALNAKFNPGTKIFGHDVSNRTIESVYQHGIKQGDWTTDNNKKTGAPKSGTIITGGTEDNSYYEGYLPLWQEWAKQNPGLIEELREKSKGKTLTDKFASTAVSQARALADILNDEYTINTNNESKNKEILNLKKEDYTFYSGGAKGSDIYWREVAKKHGFKFIDILNNGYTSLNSNQKKEIDAQYDEVIKLLNRKHLDSSTYSGKLVRRDMIQSNNSDSIIAISNGFSNGYVAGGTGYATTRGIIMGIPVHVYNQLDSKWYSWDYKQKKFNESSEPELTKNSALIGTRELHNNGKKAIESIFNKKSKLEIQAESKTLTNNLNGESAINTNTNTDTNTNINTKVLNLNYEKRYVKPYKPSKTFDYTPKIKLNADNTNRDITLDGKTLFELIKNGTKTSSTFESTDNAIPYLKRLKKGDIIKFIGSPDEKNFVLAKVTKKLYKIKKTTKSNDWSKTERLLPNQMPDDAHILEYELLNDDSDITKFKSGTTLAGVDISGKTIQEVLNFIKDKKNKNILSLNLGSNEVIDGYYKIVSGIDLFGDIKDYKFNLTGGMLDVSFKKGDISIDLNDSNKIYYGKLPSKGLDEENILIGIIANVSRLESETGNHYENLKQYLIDLLTLQHPENKNNQNLSTTQTSSNSNNTNSKLGIQADANLMIGELKKIMNVEFEVTEFNEADTKGKAGYIKDGKIYLNSSAFGPETVIHEVMHIIMGNLKSIDPNAYTKVLDSLESNDNYMNLVLKYINDLGYSIEDAKEEAFADMIGEYASTNMDISNTFSVEGMITLLLNTFNLPSIDSNSEVTLKALLSTPLKEALDFNNQTPVRIQSNKVNRQINNLKKKLIYKKEITIKCE